MRIFLTTLILVLSFQSWTKANDINEFEIEGISIGDSALEFFSVSQIQKNIRKDQYEGSDGKFYDTQITNNNFEIYDMLNLVFKKNDKNFKIYALGGIIYFGRDTQKCNSNYKDILNDIENFFPNHTKDTWNNQKHHQDPSGKSLVNGTLLILNSGATTEVSCYSWSDEMKLEDYVVVGINSKEFENWLTNYYQ